MVLWYKNNITLRQKNVSFMIIYFSRKRKHSVSVTLKSVTSPWLPQYGSNFTENTSYA